MKQKYWRGLATTTASLLVISIGLSSIADSRAGTLNRFLGTSNYKTVTTDQDESGDGIYFDSEFNSLRELIEEETKVAEQIAAEGSVLLKNTDEALPLDIGSETVTLWGLNSTNPILGGAIGSPAVANEEAGQKSYGIREALDERGFKVNTTMADFYNDESLDQYRMMVDFFGNQMTGHALTPNFTSTYDLPKSYSVGEAPVSVYTDDVLKSADSTAAVVVISRDSSEACDYNTEMKATNGDSFERPLALSQYEKDMIALAKEHSTKVIVLVNSSNPMEIEELKNDDSIHSILWVGAPGINGFLAVADILSGEVNPSGHLSDTYASNGTSAASMVNFGISTYTNDSTAGSDLAEEDKGDWYVVESEGIYVGYKYYETRYEDSVTGRGNAMAAEGSTTGTAWDYTEEVTYPFGYGLSYTTFDQNLENVDWEVGGTGTATVKVTNTGDTAGKSAVQLYVQTPYSEGGLEKSAVQLLDFGKTGILEPGESETVTIEFNPEYMASYDEDAVKENKTEGAWVLEQGDYYFAVGNGAHEALNNILASKHGNADKLKAITSSEIIKAENALKWTLDYTDIETYSKNVKNTLQDSDINNLIKDTVDYTTRADWSKGWTPVENLTATEEMLIGLSNSANSLTENGEGVIWGEDNGLKISDFILTDEEGNYTGVLPLDDEKWDQLVSQMTLDEALNFIENNGEGLQNIASINYPGNANNDGPIGFVFDQVAGYYVKWSDSDSNEPTYVSEDDEAGTYSMAVMPTEPVVAATFNKELVEREGEILGEESLWCNIPSIMAPGLNLHRNSYNGRNHEYYSEDSMLTNLMGTAVCKGGASKGLMMEVKHFAFNHQELNRVGISTFFTEQSGRENELRGFQGALESNYAMSIMTSFNRIGVNYSASDTDTLVDIVRNEWGFTGWITTDLINGASYQNWLDTINGGAGAVLSNLNTFAETKLGTMVSNKKQIALDTEFQEKMQQGIKYCLYTTARSNALNGLTSNTENVYIRTWWQKTFIGVEAALGILTLLFAAMYVMNEMKKKNRNGTGGI